MKHGRDEISDRVPQDSPKITGANQEENRRKRSRRQLKTDLSNLPPGHVVVHKVSCLGGDNHAQHPSQSQYLDVPRLFVGDSKANALRGKRHFPDVEDYLDDHPNISFIVYRSYSCNDYHKTVEDDFDRLPIPQIDPTVISKLRVYFFILRRDGEAASPNAEEIQIVSTDLQEAITTMVSLHQDQFGTWNPQQDMRAPYLQICHCRSLMRDYTSKPSNSLSQEHQGHIRTLFDYVTDSYGTEYQEADNLFRSGRVNQHHFPKLFRSNEIVVTLADNQPLAYASQACPTIEDGHFKLDCWFWDFDGLFRKDKTALSMQWLHGSDTVPISSLDVYPLRYDDSGLEERLRSRGTQFWACRKRKFVSYQPPNPTFEVQATNLRYMIDTATYRTIHSDDSLQRDDLGQDAMDLDDPPEGPFILLLPGKIRGYGFHDKKWRNLSVEHMGPIQWNKDAFERRLVLKPKKKELIKALITVHIATSSTTTTDIIEGKGKGLIILLHGGPGTGKTLTAESIAELARRPLYRVTCGDIGTDPEGVEKYLEAVLYVGAIWGCVVLLDEADVFLEERTQTDLQRNALVSVFLRVLEYYEGILILTSNRVGTFDEAFKSRVQLAMHYPSLDEEGRWEIWRNFIESLKEEGEDIDYEELKQKTDVLARHKLNGRQIRNTVNTARKLARFRKETMSYIHLDQAIDVANEFDEYVVKTHGHTDEEWNREQRTRY
ncbi:P-loop containing nucleoside triphosphate hydrolase protein [Glonium stellatum]|uniref:P-loop containing nucleoside triphosphate hydrolase protein n=1 Tax=Glonium stellatum TaxID=574774 RepID=A0A8E2FDN4_9PEZI|nr:P-loop containing nucleoside triphosphate hydrolase protein [Glonium stellatum]